RPGGSGRTAALAGRVLGRRAGVVRARSECGQQGTWSEEEMNRTVQIVPVRKSVIVEATPAQAVEFFTARIHRWWPKSPGIGAPPLRESFIEPFVGGRWYGKHEGGEESTVGHVSVWEPGRRLVVSWEINGQWKSDPRPRFTSEVEVNFIAESAE